MQFTTTYHIFPGCVTAVWGCWPGQREKFSIHVMNPSHKDTCWFGAIRGSCLPVLYQQHCKAALRREGGTGPTAKYFTDMKAIHSHTSTQNPQRPHVWDYEVPTSQRDNLEERIWKSLKIKAVLRLWVNCWN